MKKKTTHRAIPSGTGVLPLFVMDGVSELKQVRSHRHGVDRNLNLSFNSLEEAKPDSIPTEPSAYIEREVGEVLQWMSEN
jgi:hypothetical protein